MKFWDNLSIKLHPTFWNTIKILCQKLCSQIYAEEETKAEEKVEKRASKFLLK